MHSILLFTACLLPLTPFNNPSDELFRDGDRVVLLGSTVIEREQQSGYWETALTTQFPNKKITFRNLGWSGDTVWGEARAGFDTPKEGYQRLVRQTLSLKPTVILICYGTNESFAGPSGVPEFEKQFEKLLDDFQPSGARIVLLPPPPFEYRKWPNNNDVHGIIWRERALTRYAESLERIAAKKKAVHTPPFTPRSESDHYYTDNGMHLTPLGYAVTAHQLVRMLKQADRKLDTIVLDGTSAATVMQSWLPISVPSLESPVPCVLRVRNLAPGEYTLLIDGKPVRTARASEWLNPFFTGKLAPPTGSGLGESKDSAMSRLGVALPQDASFDQVEKLRQVIIEKNRQFFHRWRPQNETYLFGFRKHEQGQNAKEMPEFEPYIAQLEQEIAKLKVPVPHTYQLVKVRGAKP